MKIIKLDPLNIDIEEIKEAARVLRDGGVVVFPTETVYGVGVDSENGEALAKLSRIKNRPLDKPFTVHIAGREDLDRLGVESGGEAGELMDRFWPGPLTIIADSPKGKIGLRLPDNEIARLLIRESGVFVCASSANLSGESPPVAAEEAVESIGSMVDIVIDGGKCSVAVESTVVDVTVKPFKVLRQGAVNL